MKEKLIKIPLFLFFITLLSSCELFDSQDNAPTNSFNPSISYGSMTDQEGNTYKTVTIGTQTWMAENLRTTKYTDGTSIPHVVGDREWGDLLSDAYCEFNYGDEGNIETYGLLYNWYAVNTGLIAPNGWHVPSDEEWTILIDYLGGETSAGGKLKESGEIHWDSPNEGATNESGFTALPAGERNLAGVFWYRGFSTDWWSSSINTPQTIWSRHIVHRSSTIFREYSFKAMGYSVRCVKDN